MTSRGEFHLLVYTSTYSYTIGKLSLVLIVVQHVFISLLLLLYSTPLEWGPDVNLFDMAQALVALGEYDESVLEVGGGGRREEGPPQAEGAVGKDEVVAQGQQVEVDPGRRAQVDGRRGSLHARPQWRDWFKSASNKREIYPAYNP